MLLSIFWRCHQHQMNYMLHAVFHNKIFTLTHWGWVMHICISKATGIGSDNGLSPGRRQASIWTNAGILLIQTLGTNFRWILSEIHTSSIMFIVFFWTNSRYDVHPCFHDYFQICRNVDIKHSLYTFWINPLRPGDTSMCQWTESTLVQEMACHLFRTKLLPKQMKT